MSSPQIIHSPILFTSLFFPLILFKIFMTLFLFAAHSPAPHIFIRSPFPCTPYFHSQPIPLHPIFSFAAHSPAPPVSFQTSRHRSRADTILVQTPFPQTPFPDHVLPPSCAAHNPQGTAPGLSPAHTSARPKGRAASTRRPKGRRQTTNPPPSAAGQSAGGSAGRRRIRRRQVPPNRAAPFPPGRSAGRAAGPPPVLSLAFARRFCAAPLGGTRHRAGLGRHHMPCRRLAAPCLGGTTYRAAGNRAADRRHHV